MRMQRTHFENSHTTFSFILHCRWSFRRNFQIWKDAVISVFAVYIHSWRVLKAHIHFVQNIEQREQKTLSFALTHEVEVHLHKEKYSVFYGRRQFNFTAMHNLRALRSCNLVDITILVIQISIFICIVVQNGSCVFIAFITIFSLVDGAWCLALLDVHGRFLHHEMELMRCMQSELMCEQDWKMRKFQLSRDAECTNRIFEWRRSRFTFIWQSFAFLCCKRI